MSKHYTYKKRKEKFYEATYTDETGDVFRESFTTKCGAVRYAKKMKRENPDKYLWTHRMYKVYEVKELPIKGWFNEKFTEVEYGEEILV